ncbi:MAG: 9-O-acetyl-N-acetylneuraminate esterase, partial [Eubacteriales bacterium]
MKKYFNTHGLCTPNEHYMVNLDTRLEEIKELIEKKQYFTINRARQYGKTTTLTALEKYIADEYFVVSLDFQEFSHKDFESEDSFVALFSEILLRKGETLPDSIQKQLHSFAICKDTSLSSLFKVLREWCELSAAPIV